MQNHKNQLDHVYFISSGVGSGHGDDFLVTEVYNDKTIVINLVPLDGGGIQDLSKLNSKTNEIQ